jgi:hypothetical protein
VGQATTTATLVGGIPNPVAVTPDVCDNESVHMEQTSLALVRECDQYEMGIAKAAVPF